MPPKPQVFKTPDGKEFATRAEWRDYMMLTFYSFKNKVNEPEPLMKAAGTIDGQQFDMADCDNSTLVVMDHCEQVQIDQVNNCRVFVGACESAMFIRNCTNTTFYTCCRQLRLREVTNCTFYIYSMAEVHIEYSSGLKFAPFNGGYPEQAAHFQKIKLDPQQNLWYDVFDHNDSAKTRVNWSLLPLGEYEAPWFPVGECERAVPLSQAGSVQRADLVDSQAGGQAFGIEQMIADAQAMATPKSPPKSPPKTSQPPPAPTSPVPDAITAPPAVPSAAGSPVKSAAAAAAAAPTGESIEMMKTIFSCMSAQEQMVCLEELARLVK